MRLLGELINFACEILFMPEILNLLTLLGFGFILGLKHALDADHVVAISTIVSQTKSLKKSALAGIFWGLGHTSTLLLAGILILGLKLAIPEKLALSFEFFVGIILVALGADVLRKAWKEKIHAHGHKHAEKIHKHLHAHDSLETHKHAHKSFAVGAVHGLAGSGALTLLVLSTVSSLAEGLFFILIFGLGSVLGMLFTSAVISLPFLLSARFENFNISVKILAGVVSVLLGFTIMYGLGGMIF